MSGLQVLLEIVLVCEIEEPRDLCCEEKKGAGTTPSHRSDTNISDRPVNSQATPPASHPCRPQWGLPPGDHVTPAMAAERGGFPGWRTAGIIPRPPHEYANTD